MPATIAAARAGATTGEWSETLREVFGAYRGPTGVGGAAPYGDQELLALTRKRVDEVSEQIGHRIKILVGKPGLDGHSNGAEQIAVRASDVGMEVVYDGIRLTPAEIVAQAGRPGTVTVATNMAGRGTDIILGGNPDFMAWADLKRLTDEDGRPLYPTRLEVPPEVWEAAVSKYEDEMKAEGREVALAQRALPDEARAAQGPGHRAVAPLPLRRAGQREGESTDVLEVGHAVSMLLPTGRRQPRSAATAARPRGGTGAPRARCRPGSARR